MKTRSMVWLSAIVLTLLIAAGYLLFAPFYLEIDTTREIYQLRFHTLAVAAIAARERSLALNVRLMWWKRQFTLEEILFRGRTSVPGGEKKKEHKRKTQTVPLKKMIAALKTFDVRECVVNVDLGNMTANGIFFPAAVLLSAKTGRQIAVNFLGSTLVILTVKNNLARMAWAYIRA